MPKPNPETPIFEEQWQPYYQALGRFVTYFALVEGTVLHVLWQLTNLDDATAKALLSGVRIDQATSLLNRLRDTRKHDPNPQLDKIIHQLGQITRVRNDLLHFGAEFDDSVGRYITSNKRTAHTPDRLRETPVSPDELNAMTDDLRTIWARLPSYAFASTKKALDIIESVQPLSAWRYKPRERDR